MGGGVYVLQLQIHVSKGPDVRHVEQFSKIIYFQFCMELEEIIGRMVK